MEIANLILKRGAKHLVSNKVGRRLKQLGLPDRMILFKVPWQSMQLALQHELSSHLRSLSFLPMLLRKWFVRKIRVVAGKVDSWKDMCMHNSLAKQID